MTAPLALAVDLGDGGRITSLRGRGGEWLLPPAARHGDAFVDASLGGWDEMLPTIDEAVVATATGPWRVPDHGDAWRAPWSGTQGTHAATTDRLRLERTIEPAPGGATLRYRLESLATSPVPALWAPHPQLLLDDDATLDVGVAATWRQTHPRTDAVALPARFAPAALVDASQGAKLWLDEPVEGLTLHRADGWSLRMTWDAATLPHLAIWVDRRHLAARQVVVVEPCSAGRDSLAAAVDDGSAWWLDPGEVRTWTLRLEEHAPASSR